MAPRRSWAGMLAAALLLLAAPAAAEERVTDARVGEIAFAGDGIVYDDTRDETLDAYAVAGTTAIVLARDGRRRTLVRRSSGVSASEDPVSASLDWAASATSLHTLTRRSRDRVSLPVRCPRGCHADARVGDSRVRQPIARTAGSGRVTLHLDGTTVERLRTRPPDPRDRAPHDLRPRRQRHGPHAAPERAQCKLSRLNVH